MSPDPVIPESPEPDASDVVTGPVGSARLRNPATSGPEGAELDRLPTVDSDEDRAKRPAPPPGG